MSKIFALAKKFKKFLDYEQGLFNTCGLGLELMVKALTKKIWAVYLICGFWYFFNVALRFNSSYSGKHYVK